jgi:hypothetical protein
MHYESLRLRIVEIEHDLSSAAASRRNSYHTLQYNKTSTGRSERSPSPQAPAQDLDEHDEEEHDEDDPLAYLDDEDSNDDDLSLARFPSGSSRNPHLDHHDSEPDLSHSPSASSDEYDDDDEEDSDYDDDFLISYPSPPSPKTLQATLQSPPNRNINTVYEDVRGCRCHEGEKQVPSFGRMWELPTREKDGASGGRRRKGSVTVIGEEVAADERVAGRRRKSSIGMQHLEVIEGVEA